MINNMNIKNSNYGFTLVELSIVIVIIGLIVAGIVGGQSLIKQSQLRSLISEQDKIKVAVNAFKLEYDALPGDISNARSFWTSCGASDAECNGNADRNIDLVATDADENEAYRAWQHLTLANLYPGSFTGVALGTNFNGGELGVNLPASAYGNASITLHTNTTLREHHIFFGTDVANDISNGDILTVPDVAGIDDKIDDGVPSTGIVRADSFQGTSADCIDSATVYNLDNPGTNCMVWFAGF